MSGDDFTLKECLAEYLNGGISEMPRLEAAVLSTNPLKISDDSIHYFEVPGLQEAVTKYLQKNSKKSKKLKLVLIDWSYTLKRVPNSHDLYVDIQPDTYRIEHTSADSDMNAEEISNIMDDVDIKYLFEKKKKAASGQAVKAHQPSPLKSINSQNREQIIKSTFDHEEMLGINDILQSSLGDQHYAEVNAIKCPDNKSINESKLQERYKHTHADNIMLLSIEDESDVGKRIQSLSHTDTGRLLVTKREAAGNRSN